MVLQFLLMVYISLDSEEMSVTAVNGNKLTVEREKTILLLIHTYVDLQSNLITQADADLIEFGDNFGFNETI